METVLFLRRRGGRKNPIVPHAALLITLQTWAVTLAEAVEITLG